MNAPAIHLVTPTTKFRVDFHKPTVEMHIAPSGVTLALHRCLHNRIDPYAGSDHARVSLLHLLRRHPLAWTAFLDHVPNR